MAKILGVMIHVRKPELLSPYHRIALEEGFDDLIVFTPDDVDLLYRRISGYRYHKGEWIQTMMPYPTIGYDLGYYKDSGSIRKVNKIRMKKQIPFLGSYLGNKRKIQLHLMSSGILKPHLIPTFSYQNFSTILSLLKKYHAVIIKPVNGMGGKDILRLSLDNRGICLKMDGKSARYYTSDQLKKEMSRFPANHKFVVQKWLDTSDRNGHVYDIRVLMQKNSDAQWHLTGMAVRQGQKKNITSNLKTGGKAFEVYPFLTNQFGEKQANTLHEELKKLSFYIPQHLENTTKRPLFELGLDLCIDQEGQIWILEVNNKPGKTILKKISNLEAAEQSVRLPIQYARHIVDLGKRKDIRIK